MDKPTPRFRAAYGSSHQHLVVMIACFTLTGWVTLRLSEEASAGRMLVWFVGAAVAHDLVLFPIYASADRALRGALGRPGHRARENGVTAGAHHSMPSRAEQAPIGPSALNHIRVPALASGLLFLVYLPGILRQGRETYLEATGQNQQPYLARWLALTATLFLVSAGWYLVRQLRSRRVGKSRR